MTDTYRKFNTGADISGGLTINGGDPFNINDLNDVSASSPEAGAKLFFNDNTSDWESEDLPLLAYELHCADYAPTWAQLYTNGPVVAFNTSISLNGFVGNATVATINGLTPTANDSYLITDSGTITSGSLAVVAGDIVIYTGASWVMAKAGVGGYGTANLRVQLSTTTTLVAPYTPVTDNGKIIYFTGASNTGVFTTLDLTFTLPSPTGLPLQDGYARRVFVGHLGGNGGKVTLVSSNFLDGVDSAVMERNGQGVLLAAFNGNLAAIWQRISSLENNLQIRRAATWASTNFSTATGLPFDTEDIEGNDDITDWDSATNPNRITVNYSARYQFSGFATIDSTGGSTWNLECYLRKNGTTEINGTRLRTGNYGGEDSSITLPAIAIDLEDGDYVEWVFIHTSLTGNLYSATMVVKCNY